MSEDEPHPAVAWSIRTFRETRQRYGNDRPHDEIRSQAILGVGVLIGGGFPNAAAATAMIAEEHYPEAGDWPWRPDDEEQPH